MRILEEHVRDLTPANLPALVEVAEVALLVRGYGHIKEANRIAAGMKYERLKADLAGGSAADDKRAA
jgi:hypothetical protein